MSRILYGIVLLLGCAPPVPENGCNVHSTGDAFTGRSAWLAQAVLSDVVRAVVAEPGITDPHFVTSQQRCEALADFRVFTREVPSWEFNGMKVASLAYCQNLAIEIGRPESGRIADSALVHDLMHAIQGCETPGPADTTGDLQHANWHRAGIYAAIDRINGRMTE